LECRGISITGQYTTGQIWRWTETYYSSKRIILPREIEVVEEGEVKD
jgi:hypothetical protein